MTLIVRITNPGPEDAHVRYVNQKGEISPIVATIPADGSADITVWADQLPIIIPTDCLTPSNAVADLKSLSDDELIERWTVLMANDDTIDQARAEVDLVLRGDIERATRIGVRVSAFLLRYVAEAFESIAAVCDTPE
jgi:hypothetical protein